MYCQFYGFHEKPFSLLPDPEFLFLSQKHEKALNLLELGILNQSGFCVISGEIGAGKTTLVRELLNRLDDRVRVGLISNTHAAFSDLLGWVLAAYELQSESSEAAFQHRRFTDFIIEQYASGKHTLLIIDEAQNLSLSALEQLRMLSNINSEKDLVLQIILVGQNELRTKLQQPELEQFAQRIAIDYHLPALDQEETAAYIEHRVIKSGGPQRLFDDTACDLVYQYSKGIPRLINRICDLGLVYGFSEHKKTIDANLIKAVTRNQKQGRLIKASTSPPDKEPAARQPDATASVEKSRAGPTTTEKSSASKASVEKPEADTVITDKIETEKLLAEKLAAGKAAAEKSAAVLAEASIAAANLAAAEKLAAEKAALKVTSAIETAAEFIDQKKQAAEKLAAEKAVIEKEALEVATAAKAAAEKAVAERIAAEKAVARIMTDAEISAKRALDRQADAARIVAGKAAADKAASEKARIDTALAKKAAEEKAAADAVVREKASLEKVALARVAVSAAAAAQKEASEKEAAAVKAARKAAEASAFAEKAKAAAAERSYIPEKHSRAADNHLSAATQVPAIRAKQLHSRPRRIRSILAISVISGIMAASVWLISRPGITGTDARPPVIAGKSFDTDIPSTEAAALESAVK